MEVALRIVGLCGTRKGGHGQLGGLGGLAAERALRVLTRGTVLGGDAEGVDGTAAGVDDALLAGLTGISAMVRTGVLSDVAGRRRVLSELALNGEAHVALERGFLKLNAIAGTATTAAGGAVVVVAARSAAVTAAAAASVIMLAARAVPA